MNKKLKVIFLIFPAILLVINKRIRRKKDRKKWNRGGLKILLSFALIMAIIVLPSCQKRDKSESYATSHKEEEENDSNNELAALLDGQTPAPDQIEPQGTEDAENEPDAYANQEKKEMLADEEVKLSDIYSEVGNSVIFKCFDKDAESYEWEYYDLAAKDWTAADPADISFYEDELNRNVSGLKVKADQNNHELMVRCTIHFSEREDESQTAYLFILDDKVTDLYVEDYTADANRYISTQEIPVKVTYESGKKEDITGLEGLYFVTYEEEKDYTTAVSGNRIETTIMTKTEHSYFYSGLEENETLIRYRPDILSEEDETIETSCLITGKDMLAPTISDLSISHYEISRAAEPVTLTVSISAEDDITPYPELKYAFLPAGQIPIEDDFGHKASFDVCIEKNGMYTAYVRDNSGNIAELEKNIIIADDEAPVINSIALSNESGWCKSNTIMVDAKDMGDMSYSFENKSGAAGSGWITYSEYTVDTNGTWTVQVKDAAGNISDSEIVVSNIDKEAPIIHSISIKE